MTSTDRAALSTPRVTRSCGHLPLQGSIPVPDAVGGAGSRGLPRWVPGVLVALGVVMVPWLFYLDANLPGATRAFHWAWMWSGLDLLECLGLLSTGLLCGRRSPAACLTAVATATLLVVDAWFDTMTSAPGRDRVLALAMAAGIELPLAAGCVVLAVRVLAAARWAGRDPAESGPAGVGG